MNCSSCVPRPRPAPSRAWLWAALLLLAVLATGSRPACAQATKIIDINAVIHVTVADEGDVSGDFKVDPDGNITMLYVNQVRLAGETTGQAAVTLRKALLKFYRNPQVVVTIISPGGITVTLTGQVGTQKDYTVRSDAHLNDILSVAGPSVDADLADVQITSGLPGQNKIKTDYNYLLYRNNNDPAGNPALHDGDLIYVQAKTKAPIEVILLGDFGKTGHVAFPSGTSVLEAIQQTGGLTPTVNPKSFVLQHANDTTRMPFDYQAARQRPEDTQSNPILQDGDTLISESLATTTNTYNLTGAIRSPAQFPLTTPYITLSDAIARAGGLVGGARMNEMTITRVGPDGQTQSIKPQINGKDARDVTVQAATRIYPGDSVNIPLGRPGFSPSPLDVLSAIGSVVGLAFLFRH